MFTVAEAEAIRNAFNQGGEPGIRDNAKAQDCARTIAGRTALPSLSDEPK